MRLPIGMFLAAAAVAACGSSGDGSGNRSSSQATLRLTTSGNGLVRGAGADCRGNCSAQYVAGSQVHLVAVPDTGAVFMGWAGGCSGTGGCDLTLDADRDVSATFSAATPPPQGQHRLTVWVQGKGRVTSSPAGIDCETASCSADFASGTTVTLSQAPASGGTRFTGWGGACSGASSTCQLTLQSDTKVTAEFQSELLALAPNDGTNSATIALNSTHLFWSRYTGSGSGIWAIPKKGGDAVRVATGYANAIVAYDAYLYWTDASNLYSTPVGGGQVAFLFTGASIGRLALD